MKSYCFRSTLLLGVGDVDTCTVERNPGGEDSDPFPVVRLGDLNVMPSRDDDLAALLRRLADRVDDAMATTTEQEVA